MSYLLHLWRQPLPASLTQAETLLPDLRQQLLFEPDPLVRTLVEGIAARLPEDHEPEDCWTELPDPEASSPLLTLSPRTDALGMVLPALLDVAREQGWAVHDGQAGEVWLPDGRVLRRSGAYAAMDISPCDDADADSPATRRLWLRKRLAPVFERHGYHARRGSFWFSKQLPIGEAGFYGDPVRAGLDHGLWLRLNYPGNLQAAVDSDGGPKLRLSLHRLAAAHGLAFTYNPSPPLFQSEAGSVVYELPCAQTSALNRCGNELACLYDEILLPWLDLLQSWQDLDHWANRVPDKECPFNGLRRRTDYRLLNYHPDLLIARAVNAADFEAMARQRLALYEADAFGRGLLPQLRNLLQICGLAV
ncbi:MAG: hypothetical protein V4772_15725 [Pseudomonadota bacterium]